MNALANPEVGKYLAKYFVASFQRVGTFRIVGAQKQGGNVAAYFCAPDGRVLHAVAGPVSAEQFLVESKWVVKTAQKGIEHAKGDGAKFKAFLRTAHAEKLKNDHGLVVFNVFGMFSSPGQDKFLTVAGTPQFPMDLHVTGGGTFYQHPLGDDKAPNAIVVAAFPSLAYDTFVTIGVEKLGPPDGQPSNALVFSPAWPGFGPGSLSGDNLGGPSRRKTPKPTRSIATSSMATDGC